MGDKGNIAVRQRPGQGNDIWLTTHWTGSCIEGVVQNALFHGNDRWDDPDYLTRILFDTLLGDDSREETTGFGISTCLGDNEHPIVVVDIPNKQVLKVYETNLVHDGRGAFRLPEDLSPFDAVPFEEFAHAGFPAILK